LSKGLGAPMGSVLVGKQKYMDKAMRVRKVLGGGMRQVGFAAAAGLYALEHNWQRMDEDHKKAQELSVALMQHPDVAHVEPVETIILIFNLKAEVDELQFIEKLKAAQIYISALGKGKLRIVTHYDY
ncbi:MAG: beta-eliminating lyase-related protein, partial [Leeuwenhoekiella sp.]|nr:beta-eliminating lyase-related protein [Leeuwenhoekiella sp.]